ncbi:hypothetical protein [Mesorhizobium sp. CAU 1741]|uniref:hypothetical protein n=1 Tax=Mesorhizobium sp. CAU 1741 TaxID=3140366 RepID=UPI00325A6B5D
MAHVDNHRSSTVAQFPDIVRTDHEVAVDTIAGAGILVRDLRDKFYAEWKDADAPTDG